jgi:hypothetical protein
LKLTRSLFAIAPKTLAPSVAEPHMKPPRMPPGPAIVAQTVAPLLRSSAHMTPLFWPAIARSPTSMGAWAKSHSGPGINGHGDFASVTVPENVIVPHASFQASKPRTLRAQTTAPVFRSNASIASTQLPAI